MLIKKIRNFEAIELPLNIVQLNLYFVKYVFYTMEHNKRVRSVNFKSCKIRTTLTTTPCQQLRSVSNHLDWVSFLTQWGK